MGLLVRRIVLAVLFSVMIVAALDVVGQTPTTTVAENGVAKLAVYSPNRIRGGLLFTTRFHVWAKRPLRSPTLVLDSGWFEGMQVNSTTPEPRSEASRAGKILLRLEPMDAGDDALTFVQFQVNPTNVGRRTQDVRLEDGPHQLLHVHRMVTVFP